MKILFVSNLYPPNTIGGYERLCHEVAAAFVAAGHEVAVLTSGNDGGLEVCPGQRVHRILQLLVDPRDIYAPFPGTADERAAINAGNIARLQRVLSQERPDVIFAWNLYFLDPSFFTTLDQVDAPVVFMLTDNWLIAALDPAFIGRFFQDHAFGDKRFAEEVHGWRRILGKRARSAVRFSFRHRAIFGSDFMHRLHEAAGVGFAASKVIHNGVRFAKMPDDAFADRASLRDPSQTRLLFAGRLVDLKGVHTVIEALPRLRNEQPPVRLTILGDAQDAAYKRRLDSLIRSTGVADLVEFRAPIAEDQLFELFQRHDIYLFPSLYEPFSLTLIHALAAGIPTVASDAGGNVEIIRHRRTGLLFCKGDAEGFAEVVRSLLKDPRLRRSLAREARRVALGFSFERMVGEMERYLAGRA
jgi:glycosyltransferase involved in cell wall biosynthesis